MDHLKQCQPVFWSQLVIQQFWINCTAKQAKTLRHSSGCPPYCTIHTETTVSCTYGHQPLTISYLHEKVHFRSFVFPERSLGEKRVSNHAGSQSPTHSLTQPPSQIDQFDMTEPQLCWGILHHTALVTSGIFLDHLAAQFPVRYVTN